MALPRSACHCAG